MYCDSCGKKLSFNARYCRHCGGRQKDPLEDTLPLPIINETEFFTVKPKRESFESWHKGVLPKKPNVNRSKMWKFLYDLFYTAVCLAFIYVFATFKTIKEYQILTGMWSSCVVIYLWWKR